MSGTTKCWKSYEQTDFGKVVIEDVRGSQDLIATTGSLDIISHVLEPTLFLRKFCPDFEAAVADFSAVLYSEYGAGSCFHEIDWVEHTLLNANVSIPSILRSKLRESTRPPNTSHGKILLNGM